VAGGLGPEVALVLPLDLGHVDQVVDELRVPGLQGEPGGPRVLPDVPALEPRRAVHRRVPAADVAEHRDQPPDPAHPPVQPLVGTGAQHGEHRPHPRPVVELLGPDRVDLRPLDGITDRRGVAGVGEGGTELAGVGALEQGDQLLTSIHISSIYSHSVNSASVRYTVFAWLTSA
jgi:hypothetical protein